MKIIGWIVAVIFAAVVTLSLILSYYFFPQDEVVFDSGEVVMIDGWDITVNGTDEVAYSSLPLNIYLNGGDLISMSASLPDDLTPDAILFFQTKDSLVTVEVDGQLIYTMGYGDRLWSNAPGNVWNFVRLPENGETVVITQTPQLDRLIFPTIIHPAWHASKVSAYFGFFSKNYLLSFSLCVMLLFIGFCMFLFSLFTYRKYNGSENLLYLSLIFVITAIWGICESNIIHIYIKKSFFISSLSNICQVTLSIPIMLYYGSSYGYKKWFRRLSLVSVTAVIVIIMSDLLSVNPLGEIRLPVVALMIADLSCVIIATIIKTAKKERTRNPLIWQTIMMCALGIFECVRFFFCRATLVYTAIYVGMSIFLISSVADAIKIFLEEKEKRLFLETHNAEILRSVEMWQSHHESLLTQIDVTRRIMHDFRQYRIIVNRAIQTGSLDKAREALEQIGENEVYLEIFCDNSEIDALISHAYRRCLKHGIDFVQDIQIPAVLDNIPIYDVCIIIGNLLDNAIEAAKSCQPTGRVTIDAVIHERNLIIQTVNTFSGVLKVKGDIFLSTKASPEQHGVGISIIKKISEKYNGGLVITTENNEFTAMAVMSLSPIESPPSPSNT